MVFIEYDRILEFAETDNDADKLTWMFSRGRKTINESTMAMI